MYPWCVKCERFHSRLEFIDYKHYEFAINDYTFEECMEFITAMYQGVMRNIKARRKRYFQGIDIIPTYP